MVPLVALLLQLLSFHAAISEVPAIQLEPELAQSTDRAARVQARKMERKLIDFIFSSFSQGVDESEEILSILSEHKVGPTYILCNGSARSSKDPTPFPPRTCFYSALVDCYCGSLFYSY